MLAIHVNTGIELTTAGVKKLKYNIARTGIAIIIASLILTAPLSEEFGAPGAILRSLIPIMVGIAMIFVYYLYYGEYMSALRVYREIAKHGKIRIAGEG